MFKIIKETNLEMDMNTYILVKQKQVIIIDPGFNGDKILNLIESKNYTILAVLLTHGHFDHIRDIELLYKKQKFDTYIHEEDYPFLFDGQLNYSKAFGKHFVLDKTIPIHKITDKSQLLFLSESINVIHTPGHTFGSVMYEYNDTIFSGDTLFYDSIGRTDLFSGNFNAMRRSLKMVKSSISNNKYIYPGHGKDGLLKDIKEFNRYLK